jgi:hypothetical protein
MFDDWLARKTPFEFVVEVYEAGTYGEELLHCFGGDETVTEEQGCDPRWCSWKPT